jgi:hypothetical protein
LASLVRLDRVELQGKLSADVLVSVEGKRTASEAVWVFDGLRRSFRLASGSGLDPGWPSEGAVLCLNTKL